MNLLERFIRSTKFFNLEMAKKDKEILAVCRENEKWARMYEECRKRLDV